MLERMWRKENPPCAVGGNSKWYSHHGEQCGKWKSLSCVQLCEPMVYTVHGILQARILEWVAFSFSRGSSQPRDRTQVSCMAGRHSTIWATREGLLAPKHLPCHPSLALQGSQECFVSAFWFSMKICGQGSAIHSKTGHQVRHGSGLLDVYVCVLSHFSHVLASSWTTAHILLSWWSIRLS